jgi:hypothetical protein
MLEPQAQIIWQQVTFQESNDGLGPIGLGSTSGATGRLGVRGLWTIVSDNGQVWQPYARANLWRDWDAGATTTFGIDQVPLVEQATRLEFAGGPRNSVQASASTPKPAISLVSMEPLSATAFRVTLVFATSGEAVKVLSILNKLAKNGGKVPHDLKR